MKISTNAGKYGLLGRNEKMKVLPCKPPRTEPEDLRIMVKKGIIVEKKVEISCWAFCKASFG